MSSSNTLNAHNGHRSCEHSYRHAFHTLLLAGLQALAACAGDAGDAGEMSSNDGESSPASQDELPLEHQLAALTVRGVAVKFVQTAPDNVVVFAVSDTLDNPLNDPDVQALSIVQTYEHWAGAAAPSTLAAIPSAHTTPSLPAGAQQSPRTGNKQTADAFRAQFCPGPQGGQWDVCMTDVFLEDVDYYGRATHMNGAVNVFNGDGVFVRVREERPVKGWHTLARFRVNVNQILTWRVSTGGFYARRVEILVEERRQDLSSGEHHVDESDRFHYMRNIRVD